VASHQSGRWTDPSARDAAGAVFAQAEAERLFEEVRRDLIRILSVSAWA
jgi:hypothetical protein